MKAFCQIEQLRHDAKINMYAETAYSEGTMAYMWITNKIKEYAEEIYKKTRLKNSVSGIPQHITE